MVDNKIVASIIGMTIGVVVVAAVAMISGLGLFPSLAVSLIGLFLGGWTAERMYGEPAVDSSSTPSERQGGAT